MKILIIGAIKETSPSTGWERYTHELSKALEKDGHTVHFAETSQKILPNPNSFKKTLVGAVWYALSIWNNIKNKHIDVVHVTVEPYAFIGLFVALFLKTPYVVTVHGSRGVFPLRTPVFGFFQRFAYRRAHKIICVSSFTEKKLLEEVPLTNTTFIHNGVNTNHFTNSLDRTHIFEKKILAVGALKYRKGFHILLEAFAQVVKDIPETELHIVGDQSDAEYVKKLQNIITAHRLERNVFFYEGIHDEELKKLYQSSSIFVLPTLVSRDHYEGFGLVYLEANMYGLPVIGSIGTAAEESIKEHVSGLLAKQGDAKDLSEVIIKIFSDQKLYTELSTGAQEWAKMFDWQKQAAKYEEEYQKLLATAR